MRARASRLADRLMFVVWVTTNVSQRIGRPLVHLPAPVSFYFESTRGRPRRILRLNLESQSLSLARSGNLLFRRKGKDQCPNHHKKNLLKRSLQKQRPKNLKSSNQRQR